MNRNPRTQGICELTLESRDPERLARFYESALGLPRISHEEDRIWLACGDRARLGLWRDGEKEFGDRGGRHVHFALSVAPGELDALVARLDELGHRERDPVEHDGGDRSLYLRDPEGNVVELWDFFERDQRADVGDLASDDRTAAL